MKSDYKPIPGVGTGRGSFRVALRTRIYEGPDHLLLLQSTGYTEEYKRVFYRDIRYVVCRKDKSQLYQGITSALLLFGALALGLVDVPWTIVISLSFLPLLWFIVNLLRGPTCRCYVNTDVQTLEIPVPRRIGKIPALITFLNSKAGEGQPQVEQVQS
jgi:hypothetical protein